jgi:hypothetical protein
MPYKVGPTKLQLAQNFHKISNAFVFLILPPYVQNNLTFVKMIAYPNKVATQAQTSHKTCISFVSLILVPNVQNNPTHGLNI